MVTLPTIATQQADLIAELVEAGMDIARINCGHDGPEVWEPLVALVQSAAAAAGRNVRIAMDLAGPKIRTGPLPPQPGVVDARPQRNRYGQLLKSARILAVPNEGADGQPSCQPEGDQVDLLPIRNGLEFLQEGGLGKIVVGDLPAQEGDVLLRRGDRLLLTANAAGQEGGAIRVAINCTMPEVLADLRAGERVLFDEGRIAGLIRQVCPGAVEVEITQARPKGSRLRADKGINFPDSRLSVPALTKKDLPASVPPRSSMRWRGTACRPERKSLGAFDHHRAAVVGSANHEGLTSAGLTAVPGHTGHLR